MKRTPEKHLLYFTVLEAFQKAKGCALCELEAEATRRYLDSLLYESVNDPGVRENLVRAKGYCRRHAIFCSDSATASAPPSCIRTRCGSSSAS